LEQDAILRKFRLTGFHTTTASKKEIMTITKLFFIVGKVNVQIKQNDLKYLYVQNYKNGSGSPIVGEIKEAT
jgi:hypothetical protein